MKKPLFILISCIGTAHAATPLSSSLHAGFIYDDNVTRAENSSDIETDSFVRLGANTSTRLVVNDSSYFSLKGRLEINQYLDFSKLSNTRLGIEGGFHYRPSTGYTAIRYLALARIERRFFNSDLRDGSAASIRLGLNKRLTDITSLRLGYNWQNISADNNVFDANNQRLYLDMDFRLIEKHTFYFTLSYTDGDIVSTTVPTPEIIDASKGRIVRDDAFPELTPARFAYRLDATTIALKLGNSYAINSNQALEGTVLYYNAGVDGNNDYTSLIYSVKYFYRF